MNSIFSGFIENRDFQKTDISARIERSQMNEQIIHFPVPVLRPHAPLPPRIAFKHTLADAVAAVASKELDAAIWRPPAADKIVAACAAIDFGPEYFYNVCSPIYTDNLADYWFSDKFAPLNGLPARRAILDLFVELAAAFNRHETYRDHAFETQFMLTAAGHRGYVHYDDLLCSLDQKFIQGLVCFKGPGTLVLSPSELAEAGISKDRSEKSVDHLPVPLHQIGTGDVVFWREDFPHSAPSLFRPDEQRFLGLIYPALNL